MLMRKTSIAAVVVLSLCSCLVVRGAAPPASADLNDALAKLPKYKLGDDRKPLDAINSAVVQSAGNPQERAAIAAKLAAVLSGDATHDAKDFCCRQLYICATAAEVPVVAKLLTDEKLSHMARYVLERMAEPEAGTALRAALPNVKGKLLVGVINSIGNRRDVQAVPALVAILNGTDNAAAAAAAAALGKIAGPEALKALAAHKNHADAEVRNTVIDSYLLCADALLREGRKAEAAAIYEEMYAASQPARVRVAALRGLLSAAPQKAVAILLDIFKSDNAPLQAIACGFVRQMPGEDVTKTFAAAMPSLPPAAQAMLIDALAARGDSAARPAILALVKSQDEGVRIAAIRALGWVGDASDVPVLVGLIAGKASESDAARQALSRIRGAEADKAIAGLVASAAPELRAELLRILASRRAISTVPMLLKIAAEDQQEPVRIAALDALGALAEDKDFAALVERLVAARSDNEREAARKAMAAASARMKNRDEAVPPILKALNSATGPAKAALLGALSAVGGEKALAAVRAAMRDADNTVAEAAVRAITDWPDTSAAPDMLALAKSDKQTHKVLAVRGLVRVIGADANLQPGEKLKLYKQTFDACDRPAEKKLVLGGIADVRDAAALDLVLPLLDDQGLRNEAATAIVRIARNVGPQRGPAKAALQKVIASGADEAVRKQAQSLMERGK